MSLAQCNRRDHVLSVQDRRPDDRPVPRPMRPLERRRLLAETRFVWIAVGARPVVVVVVRVQRTRTAGVFGNIGGITVARPRVGVVSVHVRFEYNDAYQRRPYHSLQQGVHRFELVAPGRHRVEHVVGGHGRAQDRVRVRMPLRPRFDSCKRKRQNRKCTGQYGTSTDVLVIKKQNSRVHRDEPGSGQHSTPPRCIVVV